MPKPSVDTFRKYSFKLAYLSRSFGIPACFGVSATHYAALDVPWPLWLVPLYHGFVHPHLLYWIPRGWAFHDRLALEWRSMAWLEAALVGHYLVVMQFALWPSFCWFGGYAMNNLSYGGPRLTARSAVGCLIGILATGAAYGFAFDFGSSTLTSVLSFCFVLFYTGLLANLFHAGLSEGGRTMGALERTMALLEQRTVELEAARAELEERNRQLQEFDEQKTRFFQNVSHELRTPLTLILDPLEVMGERRPDDTDVQVALRNARRLLRLVNQLLDFQKLAAGQQHIRVRPVDARRFLRVAGDYFRSACGDKCITFRLTCEGEPFDDAPAQRSVLAQLDALEKVVFNYLSNALKFTPSGGTIELSLTTRGGRARIAVRDTGPGIAEEDLPKLFRVFSQIDGSTTRSYEGSGLGLALARELAEAMGGEVGVETRPGEGSSFWIELPTTDAEPEPDDDPETSGVRVWLLDHVSAATSPVPARERDAGGPRDEGAEAVDDGAPRVLVVDDLHDMRDLLRRALAERGYRVITAVDGAQGLELARRHRPDLVVTDWMMPNLHGPGLIRAIKADPDLRTTPVVLLTAKSDEESKLLGTEHGADAFLGKPFDRRELFSTVRNLLQLKAREREVTEAYRELSRAQTELLLARKMAALGQLVSGIAHEINNPTAFVQASFELITRQVAALREKLWALLPDDARGDEVRRIFDEDFRAIESGARHHELGIDRITAIVQSLLSFSRHDQAPRQQVDLHEVLNDTLTILGHALRGVDLVQERGELPRIACNPSQLGQVLMNLLTNALYAARERPAPRIVVRTRREGDHVVLTVRDNGPGVDPSVVERLFDPFVTTKPAGEGTGMGLAICWTIVREHGGELTVDSSSEGATFRVRLPLAPPSEAAPTLEMAAS